MQNDNGFTLVELAISLMIIGLLLGGILKGKELIENARVVQTIRQVQGYQTANTVFTSIYQYLRQHAGRYQKPQHQNPELHSPTMQHSW